MPIVDVLAPSAGRAITTRLWVTDHEAAVLGQVGELLGRVYRRAWAARAKAGKSFTKKDLATLKRDLTTDSTARYAGTAVRAAQDQWRLARRAQDRHIKTLMRGIASIERRAKKPVGTTGGYRTAAVRYQKLQRLQVLKARLTAARREEKAGRVSVVLAGRDLLRKRHNLVDAGLTLGQWRGQWSASRDFIAANGGADEQHGNITIRVTPTGRLRIRLPKPMEHLANQSGGVFELAADVHFPYRGDDLQARTESGSVSYKIQRDASNDGWYLTACWVEPHPDVPVPVSRVVGVDMNRDHLAVQAVDKFGNPEGAARRVDTDLTGATGRRDGHLRHAITKVIHHAQHVGATTIAIENLDFTGKKSRERVGSSRWSRRMIHGFPTATFARKLTDMAARQGIRVVAVNPAYTSQNGEKFWANKNRTRHDCAAVVIGRRSLALRDGRKRGVTRNGPVDPFVRATRQADRGDEEPGAATHQPEEHGTGRVPRLGGKVVVRAPQPLPVPAGSRCQILL